MRTDLVGGVRGGLIATGLYLVLVLVGLPVLSSGASAPGTAFFALKSAGYVVGFIPAAALAGWLGRRRGLVRMSGAGLLAHAVVLALGAPVLACFVGVWPALEHGLLPVLPGAVIKSVVAALLMWGVQGLRARQVQR